ncbi:MAG: polyprenyl synthetase family protein [Clostridiaceae bacterium]|nr:polyprenyl synthetase family protein [Clostridiaceae bacterium]
MDFAHELSQKTDIVNRYLMEFAPKRDEACDKLYEAIHYSLSAGGKRIRPILALSVCQMLGGAEEEVMPFACALEYVHTYSLIDEVMPCTDNDDLRRGLHTCHIKYSEAFALLAGDALLNHAFEVIANAHAEYDVIVKALGIISKASGIRGMAGGQAIDLEGANTAQQLVCLYNMKTGALITAAAQIGVLTSGQSDCNILDAATRFAENLGIAFQIKDDLLDVEGEESHIGKRIGHDAETGKKTYVHFFGVDGARAHLREYTDEAISALGIFGDKAQFLRAFSDYLLKRDS